MKERL